MTVLLPFPKRSCNSQQKQAPFQGTPATNPKNHERLKDIQLVLGMKLHCLAKYEVNQSVLEIFYIKKSRNLIGRENSGAKIQEPK